MRPWPSNTQIRVWIRFMVFVTLGRPNRAWSPSLDMERLAGRGKARGLLFRILTPDSDLP